MVKEDGGRKKGLSGTLFLKSKGFVQIYITVGGETHKALAGIAEKERRSLRKTVSIMLDNLVASGRAGEFVRAV